MYVTIIYPLRERFGLTNSEYVILETIGHMSHVKRFGFWCVASAKQLSQYTTYSVSTVSRCIQKLEDKGLLEKRKSTQSDTAIRPTDLWNDIIADTALVEKMKLSGHDDSPSFKMSDPLSQNEAPLIQNDLPPSFRMNDNTNNNTYINTNTITDNVESVNENDSKKEEELIKEPERRTYEVHPSVKEAMKIVSPSPTLMREQAVKLSSINVDERPFEQTPEPTTEMSPVLIRLIAIAHEIGVEIRWHGLQNQLNEAAALWGIEVLEKEFRGYGSFIATLTTKVVHWDKFKANRLTKIPTLAQIANAKMKVNAPADPNAKASLPNYNLDAYLYMAEIKKGILPQTPENMATLQQKYDAYAPSGMKNIITKYLQEYYDKGLTT